MEHSMEFHGTLLPPNEVSLSSMEFHGTLRLSFYDLLLWTSKEYSTEFHGILESPNKKIVKNHRVPWDSMQLGGRHYKWHRCSMEFHAIFHGITWNSGAAKWNINQFHGIPWNIPGNSMELWCRQMTYHLVPWNSMEHSMEFHGTLLPPNEVSLSSMEFHGTLRLSFYDLLPWTSKEYSTEFHGTMESPHNKS